MSIQSAGISDRGCVRDSNEDCILFDDGLGLYTVCDGLGGRRCGAVAAKLAVEVIRQYIEDSREPMDVSWPYGFDMQMSLAANRLVTAARLANRQVWRRSESSLEYLGMATTIAAVLIEGPAAVVANIGDSRVYLLHDGSLVQLSTDDSLSAPWSGLLARAAGSQETTDVHVKEQQLESGDVILLASDGLYACVATEQILSTIMSARDVAAAAEQLVAAAKTAGGPDNVSAVLVRYS